MRRVCVCVSLLLLSLWSVWFGVGAVGLSLQLLPLAVPDPVHHRLFHCWFSPERLFRHFHFCLTCLGPSFPRLPLIRVWFCACAVAVSESVFPPDFGRQRERLRLLALMLSEE